MLHHDRLGEQAGRGGQIATERDYKVSAAKTRLGDAGGGIVSALRELPGTGGTLSERVVVFGDALTLSPSSRLESKVCCAAVSVCQGWGLSDPGGRHSRLLEWTSRVRRPAEANGQVSTALTAPGRATDACELLA